MALMMSSALGGPSYSELSVRGCQELPMDLSRKRSPSPQISISMGHNELLDRAMGPPPVLHHQSYGGERGSVSPEPEDRQPQDLRTRPSHSIIPFHKLRRHSMKSEERSRLKKQRLEEAVSSLLKEKETAAAVERHRSPPPARQSWSHTVVSGQSASSEELSPPAPASSGSALQQMLLMQPSTSAGGQQAYPSLLYLQYCAMLQSLQLQQALRRQSATPCTAVSGGGGGAPRRPSSLSPCSTAGSPPTTPGTPPSPAAAATPGTAGAGDDGTPGRRRAPRTLTGKHVRQGRGASAETLQLLRKVLLEKARLRRLGLLPPPKPPAKARRKK